MPDPNPPSPIGLLARLFTAAFTDAELRAWVREGPSGANLAAALKGPGVPLSELAFETALLLERHGRIGRGLFVRLLDARPPLNALIQRVARSWGVEDLCVPSEEPEPEQGTLWPAGPPDVLVITALKDELDALLALIPDPSAEVDPEGFPFHQGVVPTARRPLRLAAAWSGSMGELAAADRAHTLARHLRPRWLAMCGICAGHPQDTALGDVLVADRVFNYDHGKLVASTDTHGLDHTEIFHDLRTYNPDPRWLVAAPTFADSPGWKADLLARRPRTLRSQRAWLLRALLEQEEGGPSPEVHPAADDRCPAWDMVLPALEKARLVTLPPLRLTDAGRSQATRDRLLFRREAPVDPPFRVHTGPIATGSKVVKDPALFQRLEKANRKTIGVEMEANAIGFVADRTDIRSFVVKAVSDFGDGDKDDSFRAFACEASARFLVGFLATRIE